MQLQRTGRIGVGELAPDLALAETEQELLGCPLVDPFRRGTRVELGDEADELCVRLATRDELLS